MKLTFLGDIMIDNATADSLNNYFKDDKYCFDSMFKNVKSLLGKSDYVFANLETPISYDNTDLTNVQWQFCSPREFAEAVKNMGVNFVSTANNHCLDRGVQGLKNTIKVLDEIGIKHTGTYLNNEKKESIVEINGVRIGCLAYTYGTNAILNQQYLGFKERKMVDLIQEQEGYISNISLCERYCKKHPYGYVARLRNKIKSILYPENDGKQWFELHTFDLYRRYLLSKSISQIKKKSDIQILLLHIGGQYNLKPNEYTKKTINRLIKKFNIIVANHEHVIHPHFFDSTENHFAAYAIGNFISGSGTLCKPYNKYSDYSIALHFYIDNTSKMIKKVTFSVLKVVITSGNKIAVFPVYDLIKNNNDLRIVEDALFVAKVFSSNQYDSIKKEFDLYCL